VCLAGLELLISINLYERLSQYGNAQRLRRASFNNRMTAAHR
jgi:hypothetical protein